MINKPKQIKSNTELNKLLKSNYIIEPKLDGSRHLVKNEDNKLSILRESGRLKNDKFPEILRGLNQIKLPDNTVLDGEVCYQKSDLYADFYNLIPRENLQDETRIKYLSGKFPLTFVAFDILKYDDKDLRNLPYTKRHEILNKIPENNNFKIIKNYSFDNFKKLDRSCMEGIVLKKLDSLYSDKWFKHKFYIESDFIVEDYTSETRLISALKLIDQDKNYVGKVNYINYPQTKEFASKLKGMIAVVKHQWTNQKKIKFPVLKELRSK
ncbi:MAG: hypothetical protein GTO02_07890 [Candidatus Dadabacteria bacterium]|nr:hypothetical protein [Candidatus Dadabacteria bacterium]